MMAYIFFFITAFFYLGLALLTATKPNLTGDSGLGYGLGLAFLGLGFTISGLIVTILILKKEGFNWVANDAGIRTGIASSAWLLIALTTFFCAVFKWEWHNQDNAYPQFLHWLAVHHGQIWVPLLWLVACFLSLNTNLQAGFSPNVARVPFFVGLAIAAIYSGGLLKGYLRNSVHQIEAELAEERDRDDKWHQIVLDEIAAHKSTDPIITLLSQSTQVRPVDTRAAAVAKIKSRPNWEAEILALLKDRTSYREVHYFLDGNLVEHPEQFAEPLNQSILWLAERIKADIANSNNLQSWSFDMYGVDNLLRAIDVQFPKRAGEFRPNVIRLKQALSTPPPEQFKGVRFDAAIEVDRWLAAHK